MPIYGATNEESPACSFVILSSRVIYTSGADSSVVDFVGGCSVGSTLFHRSGLIKAASEYGDIEKITGGNYIQLICDIKMDDGLEPRRIVCGKGTKLCALLLYRGVEHKDGLSFDAVSIALVDTGKGEVVDIREGRDIVFMPNSKPGSEQALILSANGSSIHVLRRVPSPDDSEESSTWEENEPARTLLGFDADEE